jgi:UDP-glucose:(heptosyl)LPS alpha-1,3-glucosyltransferase
MRHRAAELRISNRVRFFGGQQDVRPFYGSADVFALPTLYDPFPNVMLEALACGLPAVTTTTCGAAELITSANGAVVTAQNISRLSEALGRVLSQANEYRQAAHDSVACLPMSTTTEQLLGLYRRLS